MRQQVVIGGHSMRFILAAVAMITLIGLTSCGGGDGSVATPTSSPRPTARPTARPTEAATESWEDVPDLFRAAVSCEGLPNNVVEGWNAEGTEGEQVRISWGLPSTYELENTELYRARMDTFTEASENIEANTEALVDWVADDYGNTAGTEVGHSYFDEARLSDWTQMHLACVVNQLGLTIAP